MPSSLERLRTVGFNLAGSWVLANSVLRFGLDPLARQVNDVLYAFVVDDHAMYIGQTTQGLVNRMQGYRSPGQDIRGGAVTNIRVNRHIMDELNEGGKVDIYWFAGDATYQLAGIVVNVAAGLEKALIDELAPLGTPERRGK